MQRAEKMRRIRSLARLGSAEAMGEGLEQIRAILDAPEPEVRQERAGYDRGSAGSQAPADDQQDFTRSEDVS